MSSIVMHAVCRQERRRNFVHQQGKADLLKNKLQIFKISKKTFNHYTFRACLNLSFVCFAFSARFRPPMTPVFSIISSFLYMSIFHIVALRPSIVVALCLPRVLVPSIPSKTVQYAEGIHFSTHDLTFLSLTDDVHQLSVFIHHVQNLLIGPVFRPTDFH